MLTIGEIAFILLIPTMVTGFMKKRRELHKYLSLLAVFSFLLHVYQNPTSSTQCFLIFIFLFLTVITGFKSFKIKKREELHMIFSVITFIIVIIHVFPLIWSSKAPIIYEEGMKLPEPILKGEMTVEETMLKRRSIRNYLDKDLTLEQLSQLLWAAQGITSEWGGRTAPSAGATYPLEIYVLVRRVEGLEKGIYHYNPGDHSLNSIKYGDYSDDLTREGVSQEWIGEGSINIIMTADFSRTTSTYGERGIRYVYLEAGHSAQNIYLQTTALNLGCVVVGAFNDEGVRNVLSLPEEHKPIYLIPVGYPS